MAIELIPKPKIEKPLLLKNLILLVAIIFLLFSLITYFLLSYWTRTSSKALEDLEAKLSAQITPEKEEKGAEAFGWRQKIDDYNIIFPLHRAPSNILGLLEKLIHPKVWFTSFDLNSEARSLELGGTAQSFRVLSEQVLIFKKDALIEKIGLSKISFGEKGNIEFELELLLNPKVFKP